MKASTLFALLLMTGCDPQEVPVRSGALASGDGAVATSSTPPKASRRTAPAKRTIGEARRAFEDVRKLIATRYVDRGVSEDALYSGALEGMLSRLIQLQNTQVNRLLDPWEIAELKLGVSGRFSGVGVVIKLVEGVCIVIDTLPGTPGASAGLKKGDRLLAVDGVDLARKTLNQIVPLIRGKSGTEVRLVVQRGRDEWEKTIRRGAIVVPAISSKISAPGVATLKIGQLNRQAVSQLDAELQRLRRANPPVRRLVLDLRACPGGLLESSVAVASRFLPRGAVVTTIERRKGDHIEREAQRAGFASPVEWPMVVLVDRDTLSGGEIIAAALAENSRAKVVGERTAGKGTIEDIFPLRGGWGVKLSVGRFFTPRGRALLDAGVRPDFEVTRGKGDDDPQLRAALGLLALTVK